MWVERDRVGREGPFRQRGTVLAERDRIWAEEHMWVEFAMPLPRFTVKVPRSGKVLIYIIKVSLDESNYHLYMFIFVYVYICICIRTKNICIYLYITSRNNVLFLYLFSSS